MKSISSEGIILAFLELLKGLSIFLLWIQGLLEISLLVAILVLVVKLTIKLS